MSVNWLDSYDKLILNLKHVAMRNKSMKALENSVHFISALMC